jgi:hypothetical protein
MRRATELSRVFLFTAWRASRFLRVKFFTRPRRQHARLITSRARNKVTAMREKPRIHAGLRNTTRSERKRSLNSSSRVTDRTRDAKIFCRATLRTSTRRIARHGSREKFCRASIMPRSCNDDRATAAIDRNRIVESMYSSPCIDRARACARAGIASADHRGPKIDRRIPNPCSTPESATRGGTGGFASLPPPEHDPMHPSCSLLRRRDASMQHPHRHASDVDRDR